MRAAQAAEMTGGDPYEPLRKSRPAETVLLHLVTFVSPKKIQLLERRRAERETLPRS